MSILERLVKNKNYEAQYLDEYHLEDRDIIETQIPAFNMMLSGAYDGGFHGGITGLAAESRHFKTFFMIFMMKSYLDKYPESVAILFDSENGSSESAFKSYGIDTNRVVRVPIDNVEDLRFKITPIIERDIKKGEKCFIGIDSIGNLASLKEMEDAEEGKTAEDMTRARKLKSLFRIITPKINRLDIPVVFVNHKYDEMKMYGKSIMSGGQGPLLAADTVLMITKSQNKDKTTKELLGFDFTLVAHKSRFVREGLKIPITVEFNGGISPVSGLLEIAMKTGDVVRDGQNYKRIFIDKETGEVFDDEKKSKKKLTKEWFDELYHSKNSTFKENLQSFLKLNTAQMLPDDRIMEDIDESDEESV